MQKQFKIVLVGDSGVGKTSFLRKYMTGQFKDSYVPTIGVEVKDIKLKTNFGKYTFQVWDCAGEDNPNMREAYWLRADALFVMFDVTSQSSFNSVETWVRQFARLGKMVPLIICGNKCDSKKRIVTLEDIRNRFAIGPKSKTLYYDISIKESYKLEKPFRSLLESLTKQKTKLSILMELIRKEKRKEGDNRICQGVMRKIVKEAIRF